MCLYVSKNQNAFITYLKLTIMKLISYDGKMSFCYVTVTLMF